MVLTVSVVGPPTQCHGDPCRLVLVDKVKGYVPSDDHVWQIEIVQEPNRKGELVWKGDTVQHHGDGRRFVYFAWLDNKGKMFRRLKLYLGDVPAGSTSVAVKGTAKDGTPACATAVVLPT